MKEVEAWVAVERKVGAGFLIASLRSVRSVPLVREARAQHRSHGGGVQVVSDEIGRD